MRNIKRKNRTFLISLILICFLIFCGFLLLDTSSDKEDKYYQTIKVEDNDTIWSIAKKNYNPKIQSLDNYMSEIYQLNDLKNDEIKKGWSLIIPKYKKCTSCN